MKTKTEATPRPWYVQEFDDTISILKAFDKSSAILITALDKLDGDSGFPIEEAKANAELIVRCVNNFDALLAMLKRTQDFIEDTSYHSAPILQDIMEAIAAAEKPL